MLGPIRGQRRLAHRRATDLGRTVDLHDGDAERLPFADASFGTVVCALSLCTRCGCDLCDALGVFLGSRSRRIFEWPPTKDGWRHVYTWIDTAGLLVRHQTRRQGRPYTLVLMRTGELFTREKDARQGRHRPGVAEMGLGTGGERDDRTPRLRQASSGTSWPRLRLEWRQNTPGDAARDPA